MESAPSTPPRVLHCGRESPGPQEIEEERRGEVNEAGCRRHRLQGHWLGKGVLSWVELCLHRKVY